MQRIIVVLMMILVSTNLWARVVVIDPVAAYQAQGHIATLATTSSGGDDDGLLRSYQVPNVSLSTLSARSKIPLVVGDEVQVRFFDDVSRTLVLTEEMPTALDHRVFMASLKSAVDVHCATVIETSHGILIDLNDFTIGRVYQVTPSAQTLSVKEYDPNTKPRYCSPPIIPELPLTPEPVAVNVLGDEPMVDTFVDVLVVYDAGAKTWVEGAHSSDMATFAEGAVQKMNATIANTGLTQLYRFRLVGTHSVTSSQTDLNGALTGIQAGNWSGVHAKRSEVGADLVCGLIDTGSAYGTTGLGYALGADRSVASFASLAYSMCSVRSVAQSNTMTHEMGHNVGAGHSDTVKDVSNRGPQRDDYSSGYYFTANGQKYHTIMAYNADGYGNSYTSAPYFSSPDHTHESVAVGTVAKNDNARTLESTYMGIAAFMPQVIPVSSTVSFSPASGTTFMDSITVTLSSETEAQAIYYTLDEATPTAQSTRYTMPFTIDATTTVKAVAITPTGDASPITQALYVKTPSGTNIGTGVWTDDIDQVVKEAATNDRSLIFSVYSNANCGYCIALARVYKSAPFLAWAKQNKVYLVLAETAYDNNNEAIRFFGEKFRDLTGSSPRGTPTYLVTDSDAVAVRSDSGWGGTKDITTLTHFITNSPVPMEPLSLSPTGGTYASYPTVIITNPNPNTGGVHYTLNGTYPTLQSPRYTNPIALNRQSTLTAAAFSADGSGYAGIPVRATYTASVSVATPIFFPPSGTTFTDSLTITMSCATSEATIRYTTNGTEPTPTSAIVATTGIILTATTTLKAQAFKAGMTASNVVTATYTKTEAEMVTVTFNPQGGTVSPSTKTYTVGQSYGSLPTPTRSGYIFNGWYTSATDGTLITSSSIVSASNTTLYAQWGIEGTSIPEGLIYAVINNETVTITDYTGDASELIIPAVIEGLPVTTIGASAFRDCSSLTSITIPASVTTIGDYAFSGCSGLTSVSIPSGVTSIGERAFSWCSRLTSITIPASVTLIGDGAFIASSRLTSIDVAEGNTVYKSVDGVLFDQALSRVIDCPEGKEGEFEIPPSVTSIGRGAFYSCSYLTHISIPSSVTSIGFIAFEDCSSLTSIVIPVGVTSIVGQTFKDCSSLTSVTLPEGLTSIGVWGFGNCSSLTTITIPTSVTSIGASTFWGCSSLTSLSIPANVTSIESYLFRYCRSLTSLMIPSSVTSIGDYAFDGCSGLTTLLFEGNAPAQVGENVFIDTHSGLVIYYNEGTTGWTNPWHGVTTQMLSDTTVVIRNVTTSQRYPWNGLVDIRFETISRDPSREIIVSVSAIAKDLVRDLTVESLQGDLTAPAGIRHIIWDAGIDAPNIRSESVAISLSAILAPSILPPPPTSLYTVIDLSGGVDAESYPVTHLSAVPEGGWTVDYKTNKLVLRRIEAGTFMMGSPANELGRYSDEDLHQVTLTKPYYIGIFEVTQKQWSLVMGSNPSAFTGDARPVECVSYNMIRGTGEGARWPASAEVDATSFMGKLRAKTSLDFDLPTEAQWEYACRAGTTTALNSGKNLIATGTCPNMAEVGRYGYNQSDGKGGYSQHTTVGSYLSNAWGLYDMHGNVYEWSLDWYVASLGITAVTDPVGSASGSSRLIRGGCWNDDGARSCRSAYRNGLTPPYTSYDVGLRLAFPIGLQ